MQKHRYSGVGVALVTPFDRSGVIDYPALKKLIEYVSEGGVDYLVVMGTTAENPTLNDGEKQQILTFVVDNNPQKLPIIYGIGGNNTREVIDTISETDLRGVDSILSVVPYYNKPNQEGLYAHFATIIEASPIPIVLYNVPGRTVVNMTAATTLRIAKNFPDKVIAIKEASGNLGQIAYILKDRPQGFAVLSGDDNLTLPIIALGGEGVISVSVNAFPEKFSKMVHSSLKGDFAEAAELNLKLHAVTDMLFEEGNPTGIKYALAQRGVIQDYLRLPLIPATQQLQAKITGEVEKYELR